MSRMVLALYHMGWWAKELRACRVLLKAEANTGTGAAVSKTRVYTQSYILDQVRDAPKPVEWVGDSLKRVRAFAKSVRQQVGYELELVQHDMEPSDWKPMTTVGPV